MPVAIRGTSCAKSPAYDPPEAISHRPPGTALAGATSDGSGRRPFPRTVRQPLSISTGGACACHSTISAFIHAARAVAVLLAAARPTDVVLEPSAGNGLLVAQLSTIAALQLNEIDPARRARLSATFPHAVVSGHDGATIGSTLTALQRPSLILMNPPFSRSVGRGADALAAVRHLQAALKRLRPGGRLVAIMPDWFAHSARMADIWTTTLAGTALRTSIRLTNGYGKHGTGVAVRIYVIDKIVGDIAGVTIARGNVAELVDLLVIPDRAALQEDNASSAVKRGGAVSLLRAMKSRPAAAPRIFRAPTRNEVLPVGYKVLDTPAPIAEQVGVYLPYRPSRIVFDAAGEQEPRPCTSSCAS